MINPLWKGEGVGGSYVAPKTVSNQIKPFNFKNFPPLLDRSDVVLYSLLKSEVFREVPTGRVAKSVDIKRMNLKVTDESFKHFGECHRSPPKPMD